MPRFNTIDPATDRIATLEAQAHDGTRATVAGRNGSAPPAPPAPTARKLKIAPPDMRTLEFRVRGDAPYVQCRFGEKAFAKMADAMASDAKRPGKRAPKPARDYDAEYLQAMHTPAEGNWRGIPATAIRRALISACRMCDMKMTHAKLSVFVEADGFDKFSATPLVKITKGKPMKHVGPGANADGSTTVRVRAMWEAGWEAVIRIRYDAGQLDAEDVAAMLMRAGAQVGVGCGRPDSTNSAGCGWGTFEIVGGGR